MDGLFCLNILLFVYVHFNPIHCIEIIFTNSYNSYNSIIAMFDILSWQSKKKKPKPLPFSSLPSLLSLGMKTKVGRPLPRISFKHFLVPSKCSTFKHFSVLINNLLSVPARLIIDIRVALLDKFHVQSLHFHNTLYRPTLIC